MLTTPIVQVDPIGRKITACRHYQSFMFNLFINFLLKVIQRALLLEYGVGWTFSGYFCNWAIAWEVPPICRWKMRSKETIVYKDDLYTDYETKWRYLYALHPQRCGPISRPSATFQCVDNLKQEIQVIWLPPDKFQMTYLSKWHVLNICLKSNV